MRKYILLVLMSAAALASAVAGGFRASGARQQQPQGGSVSDGSGGEFSVRGTGRPVDDRATREVVVRATSYEPEDRYVLFELEIDEARCVGYGDVALPLRRRWREGPGLDAAGAAGGAADVRPDTRTGD